MFVLVLLLTDGAECGDEWKHDITHDDSLHFSWLGTPSKNIILSDIVTIAFI